MDIEAYLRRIGFSGALRTDLDTLARLHRAHLRAVPYENLDVQLGRKVTIELAPIYDKIVQRGRGGWCYEMNGLFGWALQTLGFRVHRGAGAVMREVLGDVCVGNHLVLSVMLSEGSFLADVGFGDGPIDPIRLIEGEFVSGRFTFGLERLDEKWLRLRNHTAGGAKSFDFTLDVADETLLAERCAFLQTADVSPFVQNLVCQRYLANGELVILRGRVLRHLDGTNVKERLIADEREFMRVLEDEFLLDVPEVASLWSRICARHDALFGDVPSLSVAGTA